MGGGGGGCSGKGSSGGGWGARRSDKFWYGSDQMEVPEAVANILISRSWFESNLHSHFRNLNLGGAEAGSGVVNEGSGRSGVSGEGNGVGAHQVEEYGEGYILRTDELDLNAFTFSILEAIMNK